MKKVLAIVIIIIILLAIGFVAWLFIGEKTPGEKIEMVKNFLPFGSDVNLPPPPLITQLPPEGNGGNGTEGPIIKGQKLYQLTQNAITGATFKESQSLYDLDGKVRYVEKSTGHIYEIKPDGSEQSNRISNTTILKSFEVIWSFDANNLIVRYLKDENNKEVVKNFLLNLTEQGLESATSSSQGTFLPPTIREISSSPLENKFFYLTKSGNGATGVASSFEDNKHDQTFFIPFSEFDVFWPNRNTITFLSKPSYITDGFLYLLNLKTKSFDKILGNIKGLTYLYAPSGEKIIYSKSEVKNFSTFIYDIKTGLSELFNLKTLPEKCVWDRKTTDVVYCAVPKNIPFANHPDDWYQGLASFSDSIWKVNITTGTTEKIHDIEPNDLDIINLFLSPNDDFLFFTNKKDLTLWSLKLN